MLKKLKNSKFITGDSTYAQLLRTYIVGGFNLVFGLVISYLFQFFVFYGERTTPLAVKEYISFGSTIKLIADSFSPLSRA